MIIKIDWRFVFDHAVRETVLFLISIYIVVAALYVIAMDPGNVASPTNILSLVMGVALGSTILRILFLFVWGFELPGKKSAAQGL